MTSMDAWTFCSKGCNVCRRLRAATDMFKFCCSMISSYEFAAFCTAMNSPGTSMTSALEPNPGQKC